MFVGFRLNLVNARFGFLGAIFMKFEGVILGMMLLMVIVFLRLTVGGFVYASAIASKRSSIAGVNAFDFAHGITECESRLLPACGCGGDSWLGCGADTLGSR